MPRRQPLHILTCTTVPLGWCSAYAPAAAQHCRLRHNCCVCSLLLQPLLAMPPGLLALTARPTCHANQSSSSWLLATAVFAPGFAFSDAGRPGLSGGSASNVLTRMEVGVEQGAVLRLKAGGGRGRQGKGR